MNLDWHHLTRAQPVALLALRRSGPRDLNSRLGEQLRKLDLVEPLTIGGYCVSSLGRAVTQVSYSQAIPTMSIIRPTKRASVPAKLVMVPVSKALDAPELASGPNETALSDSAKAGKDEPAFLTSNVQ